MTALKKKSAPEQTSSSTKTLRIAAGIGYTVLATLMLVMLDSTGPWYYILNALVFPLFVVTPFIILGLPIAWRWRVALLLVMIMIVMPIIGIGNSSYLEVAIQICLFAGMALGLNIVVGFAGLLDLGYVAFFASGAYLWGMFTSSADTIFQANGWIVPGEAFFLFLILGAVITALIGLLLGLPVLRLRGDYLAIVTLGFGEVFRVLARNANEPINYTNGSQGLHAIGRPPLPPFLLDLTNSIGNTFHITLQNPETIARQLLFYLLSMGVLAVIIFISRRLEESPIGRAWTAIREDEVAAISMGVPLVRMKLLAFATGASFGGAIGVLYAAKQTFIDPSSFQLVQSISILAMVIIGGMGSIRGVLLGGAIVTMIDIHILSNLSLQLNSLRQADYVIPIINYHVRDWPNQLEPAKYQPFIFGLLLVVMMLFRPEGLLPSARRRLELHKEAEENIEAEVI